MSTDPSEARVPERPDHSASRAGMWRAGRSAAIVLGTALAFKLLSDFSSTYAESWGASYLFPPAALSVAAGAAWGIWGVLGILAGVFLSPWGAATTPGTLVLFALVNGFTAAVPAWFLRPPRGATSERLRRLALFGVGINNAGSALLGSLFLVLLGRLPAEPYRIADNLLSWWVADVVAVLVLGLPLLLLVAPAVLLDDDFRRVLDAWWRDRRKPLTCAALLVASVLALAGLDQLGWSYPEWATVTLVAPIAWAAFQGGLGAAIWVNLPVSLVYFSLTVLPAMVGYERAPAEVLVPAYSVLAFFSLFSVVAGYLAGRNRQLLAHVRRQQTQLERDFERTVRSLAAAIEAKDERTVGHVQRVGDLALRLGEELGLDEGQLGHLRYAALLHDVGKIGVPEAVLNKAGPLDPGERHLMQQHVEIGMRILGSIEVLADALPMVQFHQERWDGRRDGVQYPAYYGLRAEAIPLGARILAVVDAFDAMTNDRPYRRARPIEEALSELEAEAGRQFDPRVVNVLVHLVRTEGARPRARRRGSDGGPPSQGPGADLGATPGSAPAG